jgi:hypothetical protein
MPSFDAFGIELLFKLSAEGTPLSGSRRGLEVDVAPDRAGDVAEALRHLIGRLPNHPAIVPLLDAGVAAGRLFVVVAPSPGEPLDAALEAYGPADIADALPRLRRIADALDVAARHGVSHGALRPRDIIIGGDDTSVEGIGIAAVLHRHGLRIPLRPPYVAPEVAHGAAASQLADQYSLASIAHEWLFGRTIKGPVVDAIELPSLPDVDADALRRAFSTALASDPEDRFESSTAFVEAVERSSEVPGFRGSEVRKFRGSEVQRQGAEVAKFWSATRFDELPMYPEESGATTVVPAIAAAETTRQARWGIAAALLVGGVAIGLLGVWVAKRSRDQQQAARIESGQPFTDAAVTPPPAASIAAPPVAAAVKDPRPTAVARRVADAAPAARVDAGLLVHSLPAGAAVSIDGVDRGVTPVAVRGLPLGTRTVVVTRPGYRASERQITLTADRPSRTLEVSLVPAAAAVPSRAAATPRQAQGGPELSRGTKETGLVVDSRPAGAAVTIDGRKAGVTPLTLALKPGKYSVRIEHVGHRAVTTTVEVIPGQRARVAARLEEGQEDE